MTEKVGENSDTTREDVRRSAISRGWLTLLIVVGCILLVIANVSFWASFDLFNAERFGQLVAEGLLSARARAVLANEIVDQIMTDLPNVPEIVRVPAAEIIAALLQRPALTTVIEKLAAAANVVITTDVNDVVEIDLERVVPFFTGIAVAINPELADTVEAVQGSKVLTLLGPGELPRLRGAAKVAPWLWPLALPGAIGLFLMGLWWAENRRKVLKWIGWGVLVTAIIQMPFVMSARLAVENSVTNPNARVIVGEVIKVLTRGFLIQCLVLIVIGLILIVVSRYYFKEEPVQAGETA
jgi:hypothetical protein